MHVGKENGGKFATKSTKNRYDWRTADFSKSMEITSTGENVFFSCLVALPGLGFDALTKFVARMGLGNANPWIYMWIFESIVFALFYSS